MKNSISMHFAITAAIFPSSDKVKSSGSPIQNEFPPFFMRLFHRTLIQSHKDILQRIYIVVP